MNGPVSTDIANFLMAATAAGQAGGNGLELSAEGMEGIEFAKLLSGEKLAPELMEMLRGRLAPEEFARLEEMMESGNGFPPAATFSLFPEVLEANITVHDSTISGSRSPIPGNDQLAKLLQEAKTLSRQNPALAGRTGGGDSAPLSTEEQATLKEILRQTLAARPDLASGGQVSAVARSAAAVAGEVALAAAADIEAGLSNLAQSPAAGIVSTPAAAATAGTSASALPTLPAVTVPPGDKGWSQAMGERILWMVGRDLQAASVNIKPPNLGPLHIQISIQNEQATVNFTAQHGVVKEALEAAVPRLREMLAENNIQLVNVDVNQRGEGDGGRGEAADPYQERRGMNEDSLVRHDGAEAETDESVRYYRSDRLLDDYA